MLWRRIWWVPLIWRQQLAEVKEVKAQDSQKATEITGSGPVPAVTTGITDLWCQPVVGAEETGQPWSRQGQNWLKAAKAKARNENLPKEEKPGVRHSLVDVEVAGGLTSNVIAPSSNRPRDCPQLGRPGSPQRSRARRRTLGTVGSQREAWAKAANAVRRRRRK